MPFSKYVIEPGRIDAMRSAFHKVCGALELRCTVDDPMTEVIVSKIVTIGKTGEFDADQLCEAVLGDLQS